MAVSLSQHRRMAPKSAARARRQIRVRKKVFGATQRPRLVVTRSARHISAQVIDDTQGRTLASASSMEARDAHGKLVTSPRKPSRLAGWLPSGPRPSASRSVVFDRAGYAYHGRVAAACRWRPRGRPRLLDMQETRKVRANDVEPSAVVAVPVESVVAVTIVVARPPRRATTSSASSRSTGWPRSSRVVAGSPSPRLSWWVMATETLAWATARPRRSLPRSPRVSKRPRSTSSPCQRIQGTIPHPVQGEKAAGVVMLRPASPGTGVDRRWFCSCSTRVRRRTRRAGEVAWFVKCDQRRARDGGRAAESRAAGGGGQTARQGCRGCRSGRTAESS